MIIGSINMPQFIDIDDPRVVKIALDVKEKNSSRREFVTALEDLEISEDMIDDIIEWYRGYYRH